MIPKNYKVIKNCCKNCKNCFIMQEWDDEDSYYCTYGDTEERPKCGSSYMSESFEFEFEKYEKQYDLWENWSIPREVEGNGICDKFESIE